MERKGEKGMKMVLLVWMIGIIKYVEGEIIDSVMNEISRINKEGPYLGIVVPNSFELSPLLQSSSFVVDQNLPFFDFSGRRFRIGTLNGTKVIIVMTGLSMVNAAIATQLLVTLFKVKGVLHFGIAGNGNPQLQVGDVVIPQQWAHTGLWYWQRFGQGPKDELSLESNEDYTRKIGYLNFSNYENPQIGISSNNLLNNVWYQLEEIFPINGKPEERLHVFWVPVDDHYISLARKLESLKLEGCVNNTCLPRNPMVKVVSSGISGNMFVDNGAYREFLYTKFNATPIDMESAAVGIICLQQKIPFIAIRALSDLAGGGSSLSNEASIFASLASQNAFEVLLAFIDLLNS